MQSREGDLLHRVEARHVLVLECEAEGVEIGLHVFRIECFHDRYEAVLQAPAQGDEGGGDAVLLTKFDEERVVCETAAAERAPGLNGNVLLEAEVDGRELRIAGVDLELVDHRADARAGEQRHEVVRQEVRDADHLDRALFVEVFEGAPRCPRSGSARSWARPEWRASG